MIWVALSVLLLLMTGGVLWYLGKRPFRHRISQEQLEEYLKVLLFRGFNGGFAIIEVPSRREFLRFSKYIDSQNVGLQFYFPLAQWSQSYYQRLPELLKERGYDYELQRVETEKVPEFLVVDLGDDLERAASLARSVLGDIFRLSSTEIVDLRFHNISARDERIVQ